MSKIGTLGLFVAVACASGVGFYAGQHYSLKPATPVVTPSAPPAVAAPASAISVTSAAPAVQTAVPAAAVSHALDFQRVELVAGGNQTQACLIFSGPLALGPDQHVADYVRVAADKTDIAATQYSATAQDNKICLGGLVYGTTYTVTLRAGLPGTGGTKLLADDSTPVTLGDLQPQLDFADSGFILSRQEVGGLPIATVNVGKVHVTIGRITDRIVARTGMADDYNDLNNQDNGAPESDLAVPVWQGDMDVANQQNTRVVTQLPIAQLIGARKPGAYRVTIADADKRANQVPDPQVRWIVDTDLMLTSLSGQDGLHALVRSLTSAKPVAGVVVALLGNNNDELDRETTDANGEVTFAPGLSRGEGALRPRMILAYKGDDFALMQLDKPAFDLSDRGVDGRDEPKQLDAYLYPDRGIYRPGETIQLSALLRDRLGMSTNPGPVTISLKRPDGAEAESLRLVPNAIGTAVGALTLSSTAPRGTWHLEATLAGTKEVLGGLDVEVQDFVPNRLAVNVTPNAKLWTRDAPLNLAVASRYLYGAPAANLSVDSELVFQAKENPVGTRGWSFGLVDEKLDSAVLFPAKSTTDANGLSALALDASKIMVPQSSLPLLAVTKISVAEPGGRATESEVTLPFANLPALLGLKAPASLAEDSPARIGVALWTPQGTREAGSVSWKLIEEIHNFDYYNDDGRWSWKEFTKDRPVSFGTVAVSADQDDAITTDALPWGTYRLEATDDKDHVVSSIRFDVGWESTDESDSPEKLIVTQITPAPKSGGTVGLHVKSPFPGEMTVVVANSRVLDVRTASIPSGESDLTIATNNDWGAGAYVLASVYRPLAQVKGHAPARAVGLSWVGLDQSARTLGVAIGTPKVARPRGKLEVPLTITNIPSGESVYLTLAAVDEGILDLTRFGTPDPWSHYFGKRRLGVDLRDDYEHLIDGNAGVLGTVRSGGDLGGAGLSVVPTKTVALFSGLVQVGADGKITVPLDIPDFSGALRLMAVASSQSAFGHADHQLPVRDPVVAEASLPRFLAPNDQASVTILANNVEAPAGNYHLHIAASGAVTMPPVDQDIDLPQAAQKILTYPIAGGTIPGAGHIALTLTGPGGFSVSHGWDIETRSALLQTVTSSIAPLPANADYKPDPHLLDNLVPGTISARFTFSATGRIDLAGLLNNLDEYPYGCSEQLVSRAFPLLFVNKIAAAAGVKSNSTAAATIQDAINKLLEREDDSGVFGLWRVGDGESTPYLGAYIVDFLAQAQREGYAVPDGALKRAYQGLQTFNDNSKWRDYKFWWTDKPTSTVEDDVVREGTAYAALVQARANREDSGDLRYMTDNQRDDFEPLAQAQIATGLALMGDAPRAKLMFDLAQSRVSTENETKSADYYRTRIRDLAAMISLASDMNDQDRVQTLMQQLDKLDTSPDQLTTQEQAWLAIAAGHLIERAGAVTITRNGAASPASPGAVTFYENAASLANLAFHNSGGPITRIAVLRGVPTTPPPALEAGISITKTITDTAGKPVDLNHLKQNDRLVIHLNGSVDDSAFHQTMLADLLPAGFEIEKIVEPSTKLTPNGLPWLDDITKPRTAEKRDDRFLAAIDLNLTPPFSYGDNTDDDDQSDSFNIAYVVRVVTPGKFILPAATIEDMYRPGVMGRTATGSVTIEASK